MTDLVLVERVGDTVVVSLNRPDRRNALTQSMLAEIGQAVSAAGREPNVRAVLVRGKGPVFSAGIDLSAFAGFDHEFGPD
jgi:enoyl-CoA hydratase